MTNAERLRMLRRRQAALAIPKTCRHCQREFPRLKARGLCSRCHADTAVRERYEPHGAREGEPTAEELERIIAEQSRPEILPVWWPRDVGNEYDLKRGE